MRFKDTTISSVAQLLAALRKQTQPNELVWFRGHARTTWKLVPSLARKASHLAAEVTLIKRFQQNALQHVTPRPGSEWEWLFLMQHHRAPTRLLDWTESPLAALFFAVESNKKDDKYDGAVWCLLPTELNRHANIDYPFSLEIPAFGHDKVLNNYLPSVLASEKSSLMFPVAAIAPRNSPRMAAQLGVFTIMHRRSDPIEGVAGKSHVWRYVIPQKAKARLREELQYLRFTALTLFPELDQVARHASGVLL